MYESSEAFAAAVTGTAAVVELAEFVYPEGDVGPTFDVLDGDFQIDANAAVRHNASMRLVSDTATVAEIREALSLPGTEVRYSYGFRLPDGSTEVKRVLTGEIATGSVKLTSSGLQPLPVKVFDSFTSLQWPSTGAFAIPGGQNYASAIREVVTRFAPSIRWADVMSTRYTTPPLAFATETLMSNIVTDMAKSVGAELFFDAFNELNVAPIPLTTGRPVSWTFDLDASGSGVLDAEYTTNYDEIPNAVLVTGQHSSGGTVIGAAYDLNRTSKTYWHGSPRRPLHLRTEKAITSGQCTTMARGILEKVLGGSSEIVMQIVPNPLLVVGDLCVVRSDEYGINDPFVLRAISGSTGREKIGDPWTIRLRRGVVPAEVEIP